MLPYLVLFLLYTDGFMEKNGFFTGAFFLFTVIIPVRSKEVTDMPRRGENIYKRKDGRWEARYIKKRDAGGKAIYGFVYGKSYSEVKQKVDFLRKKCDIEKEAISKLIFKEVARQWLSYMSAGTKQSTCVKYRNLLDRHILPVLGDAVMQDISASDIEKFSLQKLQNGRLDGKGGLSAKSNSWDMMNPLHRIQLIMS